MVEFILGLLKYEEIIDLDSPRLKGQFAGNSS